MKIIQEITFQNREALRLFTSAAAPRKNNMRIHYHSMIELSIILHGSGIYKVSDKLYPIAAGDVFFFRPNEAHCITDIDERGMELLNLHIAPYYLYTNFESAINSEYIKILSTNFPLISNKINDTLPEEQADEIRRLIFSIRKEFETQLSDYVTMIKNYISSFFITLSRVYKEKRISQGEKQNYQKTVSSIAYIDRNFKAEITLDEISASVGYSRCYFSSIFKKCMGMSVWDYICIKRIEEALSLIKNTDKNILEIATECGFNNTVNFNKVFRKYTNLSPSSFRK